MNKYCIYIFILLLTLNPRMSAAPTANTLQVEVLIFSGRPNPVFTITDPAEIKEITALVNGLPKNAADAVRKSAANPAVLGYRGIEVKNSGTAFSELDSFVVNRSDVQLNRKADPQIATDQSQPAAGSAEFRLDGASILENRLLALARSRGVINDALLSHIKSAK